MQEPNKKENVTPESAILSRTFKESARLYLELVKDDLGTDGVREENILAAFSEYLDGFNVFTHQMEVLALQQSRKVDREFMLALIDVVGLEKSKEIALEINTRHMRQSKKWQKEQKQKEEEESKEPKSEPQQNS